MSVQARLDPESRQALETLTRRLGMSQSEVVRASLRLMVKEHAIQKRRKIIGAGQFDSGIGDLATNKKHLEGMGARAWGVEAGTAGHGRHRLRSG